MTGFLRAIAIALAMSALPSAAKAEEWRLSSAGYGPARFGMTVEEVARVLGTKLVEEPVLSEGPECVLLYTAIDDLYAIASNGVVVRFDVLGPGVKTRSGLAVGDDEARVLAILGPSVMVQPHFYSGPENHYLTLWSEDHKSAVRFETEDGKVSSFYAGLDPQVTFVEGCA